eukprot:scaffold41196_cov63-Attheya_sp.AAC.1
MRLGLSIAGSALMRTFFMLRREFARLIISAQVPQTPFSSVFALSMMHITIHTFAFFRRHAFIFVGLTQLFATFDRIFSRHASGYHLCSTHDFSLALFYPTTSRE